MKTKHAVLTVLFASLLVSAFSFAAVVPPGGDRSETAEAERHMEIKIVANDQLVSIDADGMEVGDTRQSFTEDGEEVLVTRTEDGFNLEIDGKDVSVDLAHGEDHHANFNMTAGDDKKVIIRKFRIDGDGECDGDCEGECGGSGYHYLHAGEGEDVDVVIERFSASDRLLESGVLDDLDEEKRQEILDSLRQMEPHGEIHKQVRVMIDKRIHEEHDENR